MTSAARRLTSGSFVLDLGGTWRFRQNPAADLETIEVPGLWETQGHLSLDGTALYERDIDLPEGTHFATLEFDAVADLCRVFVNDEFVGGHEVGFTPFVFDVSECVRAGGNTIRVEVTDPACGSQLHLHTVQGKQGWAANVFPSPPSMYITTGGIWQPCSLVLHGPVRISDLWCDLEPFEPTVGVELVNYADSDVIAELDIDAFGRSEHLSVGIEAGDRAVGSAIVPAAGVELWSPGAPHLETVRARAIVDGNVSHDWTLTTGLRAVEVDGDDLLIGGFPYRMRSALHQGYWPRAIYAADAEMIERDVRLVRASGFNTVRTHLKAFEPAWLDAADRAGLFVHCDTPIGESLDPAEVGPRSDYGLRCITATREQIRRDRSRPSIVMWTLTNELGLSDPQVLASDGYRDLIHVLHAVVREVDPKRPIIENDWVAGPDELIASDVRSAHWYGRGSLRVARDLERRLDETAAHSTPLYVTEFGEWGLPGRENETAFFDNEHDIEALLDETSWPRSYDEFVVATQSYQGWANRLHAERLRARPHVKGFCVTEWTDVPHELNGLVSLRRNPKRPAIEAFRPALADVAPIAIVDRFAYGPGEEVTARVVVSNWSGRDLGDGHVVVGLGERSVSFEVAPIRAGHVSAPLEARLPAPDAGIHDLVVDAHGATARYPLQVFERPPPTRVEVRGSDQLAGALAGAGWEVGDGGALVVAEDSVDGDDAAVTEAMNRGRTVVVLAQRRAVPGFGEVAEIPQEWGPSPFCFTAADLGGVSAGQVLGPEVFHCYPRSYLPGRRGPLEVLIPPPARRRGALIATRRIGRGEIVACQLPLQEGLRRGGAWELTVLADLITLSRRSR